MGIFFALSPLYDPLQTAYNGTVSIADDLEQIGEQR
jgi:hypothetical protein